MSPREKKSRILAAFSDHIPVLKQELRPETVLIPLVLVYAAFILWGKAVNAARAQTW